MSLKLTLFDRLAVLGGVAALLGIGCGGRTPWSNFNFNVNGNANGNANVNHNSFPDAGTNANDGAVHHDGHVPDGGVPCVEDDRWELVPVPISEITLMTWPDPGGAIPRGRAVRVTAWVEVGGCDRMGGVQAEQGQQRRIRLSAYIWEYQGNGICPDSLMIAPEVWEFRDLEAGQWRVRDAHPQADPDTRLSFEVRECLDGEDCYCDLWLGIPGGPGESCQYDCMCEWPLVCVHEGMPSTDGMGYCYQTCSVDSDCDLPHRCIWGWEDMAEGICDMSRAYCSGDLECAPGFGCLPGGTDPSHSFCQPTMDGNDVWTPCVDDCDCSEGSECVLSEQTMGYTCQIPCRGNGDCPEWMMCDDLGWWYRNTLFCTGFWDDGGPGE